jgi:methylated-DNA-[protein]-cysteine S-methyltransferase
MTSTGQGFLVFDTAIGACGLAWGEGGILGVQLPEGSAADTRARMRRRFPAAAEAPPTRDVRRAVDDIVALLKGEGTDLSTVPLDMEQVPAFHRRVYEVARRIPAGKTLSYGDIARRLGAPRAARAVGQALGRNPFAIVVPCHRVLAAGGRVGGFSANGGVSTKLRMLTIEGAHQQANGHAPKKKPPAPPAPKPPARKPPGTGFSFDTAAALAHLRAVDPVLGRLIEAVGPFTMALDRTPSLFFALAEAIVYQQLTGKAAATIFGRVRDLFPRASKPFTPEQLLRLPDEKLRGAGLSRNKLLALKDLAGRARAGEIPSMADVHRMDDEAIVERLTQVRGIGRWTVEMLLMFRLGRADVLPVGDYGIRKGFALTYKKKDLPAPKALEKLGARWSPYRTVASWYLWRAVERAKAK